MRCLAVARAFVHLEVGSVGIGLVVGSQKQSVLLGSDVVRVAADNMLRCHRGAWRGADWVDAGGLMGCLGQSNPLGLEDV